MSEIDQIITLSIISSKKGRILKQIQKIGLRDAKNPLVIDREEYFKLSIYED